MDIKIYTAAKDKSQAAVTSTTDTTPVSQLEDLVMGDNPVFNVTFTDGSAAPSWAGAAGYTLTIGLGIPDVAGQANKTSSSTFTPIAAGWSGRMSLATQLLQDALALAVGNAVTWTQFPLASRIPRPMPYGGYFVLQVRVTDSDGNSTTYAELRVFLRNRVVPASFGTDPDPAAAFYAWIKANVVQNITLTGIASNVANTAYLSGITTAGGVQPIGAKFLATFPNNIQALFELVSTTATLTGFLFAPWDYSVSGNPYKWRLRAVWNLGVPCVYDADTTLWHFIVAQGAANSVVLSVDQTGIALPS